MNNNVNCITHFSIVRRLMKEKKKEALKTSSHLWLRFGLWLLRWRFLRRQESLVSAPTLLLSACMLFVTVGACLYLRLSTLKISSWAAKRGKKTGVYFEYIRQWLMGYYWPLVGGWQTAIVLKRNSTSNTLIIIPYLWLLLSCLWGEKKKEEQVKETGCTSTYTEALIGRRGWGICSKD